MKFLIFAYVIATFLISNSISKKEYPEHSSWKQCAGCPLKWGLKGDCPTPCNSDYFCDEGYTKSRDSTKCVSERGSPKEDVVCPNNLSYSNNGSKATCEDINSTSQTFGPGCICPENQYYYSEEKVCVEVKYCPNSTENQNCKKLYPESEYVACTCIKTCAQQEPRYSISCQPGCQCLEGFVWDVDKCVRTEKCTPLKK